MPSYGLGKRINLLTSFPLMTRHAHDVVHQDRNEYLTQGVPSTGSLAVLTGVSKTF